MQSAWWGHVPFAFWLIQNFRPRVLVELGTHTGVSYAAFCEAVALNHMGTSCYAVDTWQGDQQAGYYGDEVYQDLKSFHDAHYGTFSKLMRCSFDAALDSFDDGSIDLLHIDGLHTYSAVKHDFESWLPKVSERGLVLLHDTNVRRDEFGVWQLWDELKRRYPHFEFLHGFGLGILVTGNDAPFAVQSLVTLNERSAIASIRDRFAFLGERWISEMRESEMSDKAVLDKKAAEIEMERLKTSTVADIERLKSVSTAEVEQLKRTSDAEIQRLKSALRAEARARMEAADELRQVKAEMEDKAAALERVRAGWAVRIEAERARISLTEAKLKATYDALQAKLAGAKEPRPASAPANAKQLVTESLVLNEDDAALIRDSDLFDAAWYKQTYPDAAASEIDAVIHYLTVGRPKAYHPSPLFDSEWYLKRHPDVAAAGAEPFAHYLRFGRHEQREIHPLDLDMVPEQDDAELIRLMRLISQTDLFDPEWYLAQYPYVTASAVSPLLHYVKQGGIEGRNPGPFFDSAWYLNRYPDVAQAGLNPLVHYAEWGSSEGREIRPVNFVNAESGSVPAMRMVEAHYSPLQPFDAVVVQSGKLRVNLVTDSISSGSLFGGVGTAIIFSALVSKQLGADLRIITRTERADLTDLSSVLATNNIELGCPVEAIHAPRGACRSVLFSDSDFFITTSWWTTRSVSGIVEKRRIFHLLQEDERMFYAFGDERLRCQETLADPDLTVIVNSRLLFEHLASGPEALPNLQARSRWFEPAFPDTHYYLDPVRLLEKRKKNFFFYARPTNIRNLYWRGLETINAAMEEGILSARDWDIHFVGRSLDKVMLPGNLIPTFRENLSWREYAELVRQMDLGLCLMDTPHPSYPPLDLAASGSVVVTNRHGNKQSLAGYSRNILCSDSTVAALKDALKLGVSLASDSQTRIANYVQSNILRDWNVALRPTVETIAAQIKTVGSH